MTSRRQRILYSREEYFRALLPDAKDEKTRKAILAIIEEEQGRSRHLTRPKEPAEEAGVGEKAT